MDSTSTDPDKYKVIFENERVRVLEHRDEPDRVPATPERMPGAG